MKHIALKGWIIAITLSVLLSLATKTHAQTETLISQQPIPNSNIIISAKYSYDMTDNNGGFTTKTGNFRLIYRQYDTTSSGYDFYNRQNASYGSGTIYLGISGGQPYLYAPSNQGAIYRLSKPLAVLPDISTNWYSSSGISANTQGVYAVYDRTHDMYIRMMITKIEYETYPTPGNQKPAVFQPAEDSTVARSQGNLAINWVTYNYARTYNMRMQCDSWKEEIKDIYTPSYSYNLSHIPANQTKCSIYIIAVADNGQRYGYPVRNFRISDSAPIFTSHKNYDTVYTGYNIILKWSASGDENYKGYGVDMTCETCSKPWTSTFVVNGTSVNIKNRLIDLPDNNQRIKIRVKKNNNTGALSEPLYLTVKK
jgi:hypothetical protein